MIAFFDMKEVLEWESGLGWVNYKWVAVSENLKDCLEIGGFEFRVIPPIKSDIRESKFRWKISNKSTLL